MSAVRIATPKIPSVSPRQNVVLQVDKLIEIQGNVTKDTIPLIKTAGDEVAGKIMKELNKGGVFRPLNTR